MYPRRLVDAQADRVHGERFAERVRDARQVAADLGVQRRIGVVLAQLEAAAQVGGADAFGRLHLLLARDQPLELDFGVAGRARGVGDAAQAAAVATADAARQVRAER